MNIACPQCQTDNPDDSKFCKECATPLPSSVEAPHLHTKTLHTPAKDLVRGSTYANRYQLMEELGRGGMGIVYKAEDTKLKRIVALKFLPSELTHIPDIKERFVREAQAAASLDHPNICTVYEFDEVEEKSFISMAYIEGQNLKKKIESGPIEFEEALQIAIQIAEGLNEAHRKGIIHRDIKSSNIMLDERSQVKIMDFGLARKTGGTLITKEGTAMGTVAYMSPEQAQGEDVDFRTDIWSMGVVFYEMFSGQLPFKGEHDQGVVHSILNKTPKSVSELSSEIPISIGQVIERALEKNPHNRYQKTAEMLDDLKSISAGIVPEEIKARLRKMKLRKRKKAFSYAGGGSLIILVVVIILTLFPSRTEAIHSIAILPLKNLTGDVGQEYLVDGITDELIGHLSQISALRVKSLQTMKQYRDSDKTIPVIARELNVDALVEGTVQQIGENIRIRVQLIDALPQERNLWGDTFEQAKIDLLKMSSTVAQAIVAETRVILTEEESTRFYKIRHQVNPEAYEAYLKGQFHWYKFTKEDLDIALKYYEIALEKDPNFALAYKGIAGVWGAMSYFGMLTSEIMPLRKAAMDKFIELDPTHPEVHQYLASNATWFEFDWEKAEREFRITLELNPNDAHTRVFYGLFLTAMGRFEEARTQMEYGIDLDPLSAMYQTYLGIAYLRERRFDEAIQQINKGLSLEPNFTDALGSLMNCYHLKGMYEEALVIQRKIYEIKGDKDLLEALNSVYEEDGYKGVMLNIAEALEARSNRAYAITTARFFTYAGEQERALDWLEIAYEEKIQNLVYLNVYPHWDPLRDEPRFQALIKKMNFPKNE